MSTTRSPATSTRPRPSSSRAAGGDGTGVYVALLRAVNVGGRSVQKDALRDAFARAGGLDARTFIQSGNVVFRAAPGEVDAIVAGACRRLGRVLGAEPVLMVRSAAEIARLLRLGPFARSAAPAVVKRYIVFLAGPPARRPRLPVLLPKEELDLVHVSRRECWVVSRRKPNGWYGFPVDFVERAVGVTATARNWSTVTKLAAVLGVRGGRLHPSLGRLKAAPTTEPTERA